MQTGKIENVDAQGACFIQNTSGFVLITTLKKTGCASIRHTEKIPVSSAPVWDARSLKEESTRKQASSGVLCHRVAGGNEACVLIDGAQQLTHSLSLPRS